MKHHLNPTRGAALRRRVRLSPRLFRQLHIAIVATVLSALLIGMMPHAAFAQEGSTPLYLPMVSGGSAQEPPAEEPPIEEEPVDETDEELIEEFGEESDDTPFTGFDEIPAGEVEAAMLAQASEELPTPPELAGMAQSSSAAQDMDADGVPNDADNCPHQPNPPRNNRQPLVCGRALVRLVDRLVFLHSRIFLPRAGFDPGLKRTQPLPRIHVLLYVHPNDNGVMLHPQQRANLQSLGVNFLGYLPHNTYIISLPRDVTTLQQIVALEHVRGIGAIRPKDKVAPTVRVQGPVMGLNQDGTLSLDVDFFSDVPQTEIEARLSQLGFAFTHQYEHTYQVTVAKWEDLRRLAIQDMVYYIDDLPDEVFDRTQDGQALINGQTVSNTMGYRGSGIVVSMTESGLAEPIDRPEVNGRVTLGNNPILEPLMGSVDHPQMVSSIMIANETTFPTRAGLLPEAGLISYSTAGLTLRAQHFGVNEEAHDDFGAILSNNSWGPNNCAKAGKYSKRGKYFDRAVYDVGIAIVYATGNTRGPDGDFADAGCEAELYSLPHPVAKNDISVGNWSIDTNALASTSSAGPALDERLKPDLVAPGQSIDTIGWDETNLVSQAIEGGGTSAASPVTSGVVGWLAESFVNQGVLLDTIMPARYKAILVHTAKDVGPSGPDYKHGYGLIQADRAVRIAEEWSLWGREGVVDATTTSQVYPFDVNTPMTFYKATLVWDDEEGENTSTLALKNDLDLTLISPSGVAYYPYDLVLPAGAVTDDGSVPCDLPACQDRLNNVEMVLALPDNSDYIELGTWEAVVTTHRLISSEQSFSLVLTPPCPVELTASVTLTDDIRCIPHELEPSGVLIQTDGVNLNCDNHQIHGDQANIFGLDGSYAGVRVLANDVVVRNCDIRRFDVGIKVGDASNADNAPTDARLRQNTLSNNGTIAIELVGDNHLASDNDISQMLVSNGKGITVRGDSIALEENNFFVAHDGAQNNTIAILVHANSDNGTIARNTFSGLWWYGIRLRSLNGDKPIYGFVIDGNEFEGIDLIPIELNGATRDTNVTGNIVTAWGLTSPGINVIEDSGVWPINSDITGNQIAGFTFEAQQGVQVSGAENTHVLNNTISLVAAGIVEENAMDTLISGNVINPAQPPGNYITPIGISSSKSYTQTLIRDNEMRFTLTGIVVESPIGNAAVIDNGIGNTMVGIRVNNALAPSVSLNGISATAVGIGIGNAPDANVGENTINMNGAGAGITVGTSNAANVANNTIESPVFGIVVTSTTTATVMANVVESPADTGIVLGQDSGGWVQGNEVNDSVLGIHYRRGKDATLLANTVNSLAGGTGIQLGTGQAGCPVNVDNILVQDNVLNNVAIGVDVLCDVGAHTLINN